MPITKKPNTPSDGGVGSLLPAQQNAGRGLLQLLLGECC
jgi:hypothetical protein